jgi:NodT family efflux transporter outer membrane factor (OMF) lipoprotein
MRPFHRHCEERSDEAIQAARRSFRALPLDRVAARAARNDGVFGGSQHLLVKSAVLLAAVLALSGCSVGPDYVRPGAAVPAAFKEAPPAGWKVGTPMDAIDRGDWWSVYHDPELDRLEREVNISNQTLAQAVAAYAEAKAVVQQARGELFPTIGITPGVTVANQGGNISSGGLVSSGSLSRTRGVTTNYSLEANANWDVDVWGKIRRTVESDVAAAQASAADIANARLSAQASLATDYFALRSADSLQRLLDDTVKQYQRSLQITQNQYAAGTAAQSDVLSALTLLQTTQAQAINVGVARAQYEHAIAVLTGHPPAELTIPPAALAMDVPQIPVTVPAALLERRPDVAAAERQMQQENALIGVAVAAFYPDVSLTALYGYVGNPIGSLIQTANKVWSLGGSAAETVFDGGIRSGQVAAARATYDESVANYRQTVLTAFQNVEDDLSGLRILAEQARAQDLAVSSANKSVQIALNEYLAGTQAYTTVITAQTTALSDEESALSIRQTRFTDSVALIEALGGGWDTSQLPSGDKLRDTSIFWTSADGFAR